MHLNPVNNNNENNNKLLFYDNCDCYVSQCKEKDKEIKGGGEKGEKGGKKGRKRGKKRTN